MRRPQGMPAPATTASADAPAFAIEAKGLRKLYGGRNGMTREALAGIDLQIPRGSIFGLLGPNGAGKSTFINILAGLVRKSAGSAHVWGIDIERFPRAARGAMTVADLCRDYLAAADKGLVLGKRPNLRMAVILMSYEVFAGAKRSGY